MKHNPTIASFHKQTCSSPELSSHILQNKCETTSPLSKLLSPVKCMLSVRSQEGFASLCLPLETPDLPPLSSFL